MIRVRWMGWLAAGLLLGHTSAVGLAAPAGENPLEGRVLQHSSGSVYLYHRGLKFSVHMVQLGDHIVDAIPTATAAEWESLFGAGGELVDVPRINPEPFPGYS
jgi:hypothetical protein